MKISCTTAEALLAQYEALDAAEREHVAEHIAECSSCRDSMALVQAFGERLHEEAGANMPPDLTERIMGALETQPAPAPDNRPLVALLLLLGLQIAILLVWGFPTALNPSAILSFAADPLAFAHAVHVPFTATLNSGAAFLDATLDSLAKLERPDYLGIALVITVFLSAVVLLQNTRMKGYRHA
jgi:predicted anti-sigma-YlaC factor YlaD